MGPSVKFVSAIKDAIFNKNWGKFFSRKKDQTGGGRGSEGGLVKDQTFYGPSLTAAILVHTNSDQLNLDTNRKGKGFNLEQKHFAKLCVQHSPPAGRDTGGGGRD